MIATTANRSAWWDPSAVDAALSRARPELAAARRCGCPNRLARAQAAVRELEFQQQLASLRHQPQARGAGGRLL